MSVLKKHSEGDGGVTVSLAPTHLVSSRGHLQRAEAAGQRVARTRQPAGLLGRVWKGEHLVSGARRSRFVVRRCGGKISVFPVLRDT